MESYRASRGIVSYILVLDGEWEYVIGSTELFWESKLNGEMLKEKILGKDVILECGDRHGNDIASIAVDCDEIYRYGSYNALTLTVLIVFGVLTLMFILGLGFVILLTAVW